MYKIKLINRSSLIFKLLDNDIPGIDETRLREARPGTDHIVACADVSSGSDEPDTSDRREATATCVGRVIIRPEEPGRDNGLDEAVTAELVGQPAIDLCAQIGDDIPI